MFVCLFVLLDVLIFIKKKNINIVQYPHIALNYLVVLTAAHSAVFHWHWLNTNGKIGRK